MGINIRLTQDMVDYCYYRGDMEEINKNNQKEGMKDKVFEFFGVVDFARYLSCRAELKYLKMVKNIKKCYHFGKLLPEYETTDLFCQISDEEFIDYLKNRYKAIVDTKKFTYIYLEEEPAIDKKLRDYSQKIAESLPEDVKISCIQREYEDPRRIHIDLIDNKAY